MMTRNFQTGSGCDRHRFVRWLGTCVLLSCAGLAAPVATGQSLVRTAADAAPETPPAANVAPAGPAEPAQSATDGAPSATVLTDQQVAELIQQLSGRDFAARQQAIQQLRAVSAPQLSLLMEAAEQQADGEVCRRLCELLESFYLSNDAVLAAAASEALEQAAGSPRWLVAETATDILNRQWKQRGRLAIRELQSLGARFNSENLEQFALGPNGRNAFLFQPMNLAQLQINVDKSWTGGDRGLQLLERLGSVAGANGPVGEIRLAVYLIDQHPLTEPDIVRLRSAFGDARVVARGRVCLGITNNLFFGEEKGCRVGEVRENTSAHAAGILSDDIILAVEGTEIQDFDHLVQLLRKYDVGDKVRMDIVRGDLPFRFPDAPRGLNQDGPGLPEEARLKPRRMTITVELKGW